MGVERELFDWEDWYGEPDILVFNQITLDPIKRGTRSNQQLFFNVMIMLFLSLQRLVSKLNLEYLKQLLYMVVKFTIN